MKSFRLSVDYTRTLLQKPLCVRRSGGAGRRLFQYRFTLADEVWFFQVDERRRRFLLHQCTECAECHKPLTHFQLDFHNKSCIPGQRFICSLRPWSDKTLLTLDHIIPKTYGGTRKASNVQCLCSKCNSVKSDNLNHLTPDLVRKIVGQSEDNRWRRIKELVA
jgi:5-methylcytosine-specific restriction endonuclease McrA